METKIAILSDIHGNLPALNAVIEDIYRNDIKMIINLGDCVYGPLWPQETALAIQQYEMISVRGNEDEIIFDKTLTDPTLDYVRKELTADSMEWLRSIPFNYDLEGILIAFHGSPSSNHNYLIEKFTNTPDHELQIKSSEELELELKSISQMIILCGHSHKPGYRTLSNGKHIINPGSIGLPAYFDEIPYPHKIENHDPSAHYTILEIEGHDIVFFIKVIHYVYQWAALKARKNNREDWFVWLMTGKA